MLRLSCAAVSVVGGLLLLAACGDAGTAASDDGVGLPDREAPRDPGDGSAPDGAQPSDSARPDVISDAGTEADAGGGLRVFVSSTASTGNFPGLNGADMRCKTLATAAGLPGIWAAWLSEGPAGPHAVDRVTSAGPWRLVSGEVVAATKAGLTSGTLLHAIDHDEKGVAVTAGVVWTGSGSNGQYLTNDCAKWTTGTSGRVGVTTSTAAAWTSAGVIACTQVRRIYCFQL